MSVLFTHIIDICHEVQILQARQVFIQIRIVRDVGRDLFAFQRLCLHIVSSDLDLADLEIQDAHDRADRCTLTGAVMPDKAENISALHRQAHAVTGLLILSVNLGVVVDLQYVHVLLLILRNCPL